MTDEQKQIILERYLQWVDDITETIPEKSVFSPEEIVMKVLQIVEQEFQ